MKRWAAAVGVVVTLALFGCGSGGGSSSGGNNSGGSNSSSFRSMTSTADTSGGTGAVQGTVYNPSGQPVAGAAVTVTTGSSSRASSGGSFSTATDSSGQFVVGHMPPGSYNVHITDTGSGTVDLSVEVSAGQVKDQGHCGLQHHAGDGVGGGDLHSGGVSSTTGVIVGQVVDSSNAPVAGASVDAGNGHVGRTNHVGLFAIGGLDAGTYTVTVQAFGFADASQSATVTAGASTLLQFTLTAGTGTGAAAPATITGTVTDASTQLALAGATIQLTDTLSTTSDANGAFSFTNVKAGGYRVKVSADSYHSVLLPLQVGPGATVSLPVALTPSSGSTTAVGTLVVKVQDAASPGTAVAPAMVVIDDFRPFFTDANGQLTITNVPVGSHNLVVQARGYIAVHDVATVTASQTTTVTESLTARPANSGPVAPEDGGLMEGHGHH